jgi:hypothetical protein
MSFELRTTEVYKTRSILKNWYELSTPLPPMAQPQQIFLKNCYGDLLIKMGFFYFLRILK